MNYFNRDDTINKSDSFKIRQIPHLVSPAKISQLNFSHNDIRNIPFHITSAINLQILDLSHNKISKIQYICQITSLKFINLSHNLITQLPQETANLIEVQNIDLSFNKINIMSSIKVLKVLFQLRMLQYKGFLEINLEGNEVLKKKGCKQLYSKWKNPSQEEINRSLMKMNSDSINRTKKRNAKSVQLPFRQKQSQLIQTNRTVLMPQSSKLMTSFKLNRDNHLIKKHEISIKPQQMTQTFKLPVTSTQSQELKLTSELQALNSKDISHGQELYKVFNFKDISILQEDQLDNSNLNDWFRNSIEKLKILDHTFRLIVDNEDFRSIQPKLKQKLNQESLLAQQLSNIAIQAIKSSLTDKFSKQYEAIYRQRVQTICQQVKFIHKELIKCLNQKENLPIKLYKPWVLHYRKLKSLIAMLAIKIGQNRQNKMRQKQIQELIDISPQKSSILGSNQLKQQKIKSSAKRRQFDRLNELLYSKGNEQCLLLSDGKRSNSQKKTCKLQKEDVQCDSCLMMKWESNKYQHQVNQLGQQVKILTKQKEIHLKRISELQAFKQKYLSLQRKQQLIIEELEMIQPSTYQNMLLQQAKTIQYMLAIQPLRRADDYNFNIFRSKELFPTSVCTQKHQIAMNTRLSSNKEHKGNSNEWKNKVSEFTVEINNDKSVENQGRTSSYFKNKNVITTLNKSSDKNGTESNAKHSISVNKYKNDEREQHKVVVSQFNSQANSFLNSDKKQINEKNKSIQNKRVNEKVEKNSKLAQKQSANSKKNQTSSDIILISQSSERKKSLPIKNQKNAQPIESLQCVKLQEKPNQAQKKNSLQRQKSIDGRKEQDEVSRQQNCLIANKFGGKIDLKRPSQVKKRTNSMNKQNKPASNSMQKINQSCQQTQRPDTYKYKDHGYVPLQSSQADSYKRYMQYHLRNNIIQILSKKGNHLPEAYDKKLLLLTKSQKLIHKRGQSSRSQIEKTIAERQASNAKANYKALR